MVPQLKKHIKQQQPNRWLDYVPSLDGVATRLTDDDERAYEPGGTRGGICGMGAVNNDDPNGRHGDTSNVIEVGFATVGGANDDDPNGFQGDISSVVEAGFVTVSKSGGGSGGSAAGHVDLGSVALSSSCSMIFACARRGVEGDESLTTIGVEGGEPSTAIGVEGGEPSTAIGVEDRCCTFLGCLGHRTLFSAGHHIQESSTRIEVENLL